MIFEYEFTYASLWNSIKITMRMKKIYIYKDNKKIINEILSAELY